MSTGLTLPGVSNRRLAVLLMLVLAGCGERAPTSPGADEPDLARGGGGGRGPTVKSTSPAFAPRGSTINVRVFGTGYDQGSRAVWALNGDTAFAVTRVKANSTVFVSSTELLANITIESDASIDRYDVMAVTSGGKKGIGLELFAVTLEVLDLGIGDGSTAMAINSDNRIVGLGGSTGAFAWQNGVITSLSPLPGSTSAQADDINTHGWIVGTSSNATTGRAVLWIPDAGGGYGVPIDLGTLGGCCSQATAINDNGVIAGHGWLPGDAGSHAVVWDANQQIHDIHTVQGGESFAWGINTSGQVVGQWNGATHQQAFRYTPAVGMELLAGLGGGVQGVAIDINTTGQAVGWSGPSTNEPLRATLWAGSTITEIGTAGGASSVGWAIDDDGWVVGRTDTGLRRSGSLQFVAFVWNATDQMRTLALPTGTDYAQAIDINAGGWIVGESWLVRGINRATLWRPQAP